MTTTISTRIMSRSIIRHIEKKYRGASIGEDYSFIMEAGDGRSIVSAQGYSDMGLYETGVSTGTLALIRALNNLAMSGAEATSCMIDIIATESCLEQELREEMLILTKECEKRNIRIAGGNTLSTKTGPAPYEVLITAYGLTKYSNLSRTTLTGRQFQAGDRIVVCGAAGHFGASVLARKYGEKMTDRFAPSYLEASIMDIDCYEVTSLARTLLDAGAGFLHDVTYGGIYRTLFEIAEYTGKGVKIIHEKLPIRQDTIEICEYMNINPYELLGTGAVAAVVAGEDMDDFEKSLQSSGVPYSIAGELTKEKERIVVSEKVEMHRFLGLYSDDEINKVIIR